MRHFETQTSIDYIPVHLFPFVFDLNWISGKLSMEAIQVVFEELRKKGKFCSVSMFVQCWDQEYLSHFNSNKHFLIFMLSDLREPGMAGQKQVSVFSHVETTGGMGQVNVPVGES